MKKMNKKEEELLAQRMVRFYIVVVHVTLTVYNNLCYRSNSKITSNVLGTFVHFMKWSLITDLTYNHSQEERRQDLENKRKKLKKKYHPGQEALEKEYVEWKASNDNSDEDDDEL